jgi:hypothetical protein
MANKVNIVIDQGSTFNTRYVINDQNDDPINFSAYTANSQMRKSYSSSNAYTFGVTLNSNGEVFLSMSANTTGSIPAGRYVYDVEVQSDAGIRSRIVEGIVTVTPQVTS